MLNGNETELARKEAGLIAGVEKMLPDFARACRAHDNTVVTMHQEAFAADYQEGDKVRGHLRQRSPDRRNEQADFGSDNDHALNSRPTYDPIARPIIYNRTT